MTEAAVETAQRYFDRRPPRVAGNHLMHLRSSRRGQPFGGAYGPVSRKDIDETLLTKLPDRLNRQQKRNKIRNLLQGLRTTGNIANQGTRKQPEWIALKALDD